MSRVNLARISDAISTISTIYLKEKRFCELQSAYDLRSSVNIGAKSVTHIEGNGKPKRKKTERRKGREDLSLRCFLHCCFLNLHFFF